MSRQFPGIINYDECSMLRKDDINMLNSLFQKTAYAINVIVSTPTVTQYAIVSIPPSCPVARMLQP